MGYQTGSGTVLNGADLISVLKVFLEGEGWTISHFDDAYSDGTQSFLMVTKGGHYFKFLGKNGANDSIYTGISAGIDVTETFTNQPDSSPNVNSNYNEGPYVSYHFFEGDDFIHVVVEKAANYFFHFGVGVLEKSGDYVGGEYAYGTWLYSSYQYNQDYSNHSYPFESYTYISQYESDANSVIRFDEGGNHYERFGYFGTANRRARAIGNCKENGPMNDMWHHMPNAFNGLSPLLPLMVFCKRDDNVYNMLGCVKNFRQTTMSDRQPAEEIGIGPDTWIVFPIVGFNTSGSDSGSYAIAYKKEV